MFQGVTQESYRGYIDRVRDHCDAIMEKHKLHMGIFAVADTRMNGLYRQERADVIYEALQTPMPCGARANAHAIGTALELQPSTVRCIYRDEKKRRAAAKAVA